LNYILIYFAIAAMFLGGAISAGEHEFNRFVVLWGSGFLAFLSIALRELKEVRRSRAESGLRSGLYDASKALDGEMAVDQFTAVIDGTSVHVRASNLDAGLAKLLIPLPDNLRHLAGLTSVDLSDLQDWLPPSNTGVSVGLTELAADGAVVRLEVSETQASVEFKLAKRRSAPQIRRILRETREVLAMLETVPDWLLAAADSGDVRQAQALNFLGTHFPSDARTIERLQNGLQSDIALVRCSAACNLSSGGESVLLELATSDLRTSRSVSRDALAGLIALTELIKRSEAGRIGDIGEVLRGALRTDEPRILAALKALERRGDPGDFPIQIDLAEHNQSDVLVALVRCLRVFGQKAQNTLLDVIDQGDRRSSELALEALARFGTINAVERLNRELPRLAALELEHDAKTTIWSIQDRVGDAEGGRLSVADEVEGGALSVAVQEGGLAIERDSSHSKLEETEQIAEEVEA